MSKLVGVPMLDLPLTLMAIRGLDAILNCSSIRIRRVSLSWQLFG
jgi:hypothetical protein